MGSSRADGWGSDWKLPRAVSPKGETWHPPPVSDHSALETEVTASSWHPPSPDAVPGARRNDGRLGGLPVTLRKMT